MEKFPESHRNIVDDEHCFSSIDRRLVGEDYTGFRGHAASMCLDLKGRWEEHLPLVELAYNNSYPTSIQMAPYEALYERPCRSPICGMEVGEGSITGPNLIRDTSGKVDSIWKHLLMAQIQ